MWPHPTLQYFDFNEFESTFMSLSLNLPKFTAFLRKLFLEDF